MLKICVMHPKLRKTIVNCKIRHLDRKNLDIFLVKIIRQYEILIRIGKEKGVEFLISSYEYYNKGIVKKALVFDGSWKIVNNREFDMVFDKSHRSYQKAKEMVNKKFLMINSPVFTEKIEDKYSFYKIFRKLMPKTFLVDNKKELDNSIKKLKTKKIVLKPRVGTGGKGVKVIERTPKNVKKGTLVQEFVGTKEHPKFGKVWDMRIMIMNGRIDHSYVRSARKNPFLTNVHLGGKMFFVKKNQIPESVKRIVKSVDKVLEKFGPRFYSLDFMIDKNKKPWLIEGNSRPGIMGYYEIIGEGFFIRLLNFFKNSYRSRKKA